MNGGGVLFCKENAKVWPILAPFNQFWLFGHKFTHFLGYFLQAQIVWWFMKKVGAGGSKTRLTKKMPKIDTLDALEEHKEHEDDYQTNSN